MKMSRGSGGRSSRSDRAYNEALRKLLDQELAPGQLLNRRTLSEQFSLSVAPILEVVIHLEAEGFLETIWRKGTQFRVYSNQDLFEQIVLREALECQATLFNCGEPVRQDQEKLFQLAEESHRTSPSSVDHWRQDLALRMELVELSRIDNVIRRFGRFVRLNMVFVLNRLMSNTRGKGDITDRFVLIRSLQTDNPDEAERAMQEHIEIGRESLFARSDRRSTTTANRVLSVHNGPQA